jgi:hypothetical protein
MPYIVQSIMQIPGDRQVPGGVRMGKWFIRAEEGNFQFIHEVTRSFFIHE